jgi:alpha-1,3-rhamnosyl/mannosyltransferase
MRLVMGGESLEGPLTGIGQYTYHLAEQIGRSAEVEEFQFLIHGRLRATEAVMANCRPGVDDIAGGEPRRGVPLALDRLRSAAARNRLLVYFYERLIPVLERWSLRNFGANDIFHSPNYMLPDFPGRTVVTIHDLSTYRYPEHHPQARVGFVNSHIERALKGADHILTVSNTVRHEIIERFNYPEERITTTYEGANDAFRPLNEAEFATVAAALGLPYKGYFLFVASIEPRKNLERLLDAYLEYRAAAGDSTLPLIVSGIPGWNSRHTHQRLQRLEEQGAVRYLGYVAQHLLPGLIAGARALLYPSLYEGFGLPVLEAMQSGTAVMASAHSAMSEVGGDAVALVDPLDIDQMADVTGRLASDNELVASLATRGLSRASRFSWKLCAEQTLHAYRSMVA